MYVAFENKCIWFCCAISYWEDEWFPTLLKGGAWLAIVIYNSMGGACTVATGHPASHVTLWLSSGKFASGSDFKGGAFFLKGGAFFVGILPPLIFREMMQKPTPFFLPPLIIFGKKRAPLNN